MKLKGLKFAFITITIAIEALPIAACQGYFYTTFAGF